MEPTFTLDPTHIQQGRTDAEAKIAAAQAKQDNKGGKDSQDQPSTPPPANTASPTPVQLTTSEDRIISAANADLNDWWSATGRTPRQLTLTPTKDDSKLGGTTEWSDDGRNFKAIFVIEGWRLVFQIRLKHGWQNISDPQKIDEAIQAEADLEKKYGQLIGAWFQQMEIPTNPPLKGNLEQGTIEWEMDYGGVGLKFLGTVKDGKLQVQIIPDHPNFKPVDVTTKENYDKAIADPPLLTPDEAERLQTGAAKGAIGRWLGQAPDGYVIVFRSPTMIVLDFELGPDDDRKTFWGQYTIATGMVDIYLQVPPTTKGSQEFQSGKHFLPVATKDELDKLLTT